MRAPTLQYLCNWIHFLITVSHCARIFCMRIALDLAVFPTAINAPQYRQPSFLFFRRQVIKKCFYFFDYRQYITDVILPQTFSGCPVSTRDWLQFYRSFLVNCSMCQTLFAERDACSFGPIISIDLLGLWVPTVRHIPTTHTYQTRGSRSIDRFWGGVKGGVQSILQRRTWGKHSRGSVFVNTTDEDHVVPNDRLASGACGVTLVLQCLYNNARCCWSSVVTSALRLWTVCTLLSGY